MFFSNSRNTLSAIKNVRVTPIDPTITNYVVGFIDESESNYVLDTEGDEVGGCWERDVASYLLETEGIPNEGGKNNYIVFDLLVSQIPIWPINAGASPPPIRLEHVVEIERPSEDDPVDQTIFFNRVIQNLEARWTTGFWDIIRENNKKFVVVIDDSGSMRTETIQGAITLLIAYAESKGIPSESIIVLESCADERWLKWGPGGLLNRESDLGCLGACETTNIKFCRWTCTEPSNSECYQQSITFPVPRIVFACNDLTMQNPIEYPCPPCAFNCNENSGTYFWVRDPRTDESCSAPFSCIDGEISNTVNGTEVWAPGWRNTTAEMKCLCAGGNVAGPEVGGASPNPVLVPCGGCTTSTVGQLEIPCGCTNPIEAPVPCGTGGLTAPPFTFYKCVDCIYPNDTWDKITWPPASGEFGGGEYELCRMANCSFTAGTTFGYGIENVFSCDDCEYAGCADCINEANDPFTAHSTSGCNNSWIACQMSNFEPSCCDTVWNQTCVEYAIGLVNDALESFLTQNYGWTSDDEDYSLFGCTGYFVDYKDVNGKCLPCPAYHPTTNHPLYAIAGCVEGCTNCAKESGFTAQDYEYLWVLPWNRCGIDCG